MPNEVRVTASIEVINGEFKFPRVGQAVEQFDQTNQGGGGPGTVTATTAAAGVAIDLTGFTNPGWARFENLDGTNFVEIGHFDGTTFFPVLRLKPGEPTVCRISQDAGLDLRVRADTANCLVQANIFED